MKKGRIKATVASRVRESAGFNRLLQALTTAVERGEGTEAVRILSRLQPDTLDSSALELAARALYLRALQGYASEVPLNAIVADLSLASRYRPGEPQIWFHLGLAYLKSGMHSKAMKSFRKAVDLAPSSARYTYHAAWTAVASSAQDVELWLSRLNPSAPETVFLRACSRCLLERFRLASVSMSASASAQPLSSTPLDSQHSAGADAAVDVSNQGPGMLLLRVLTSRDSSSPLLEGAFTPMDPGTDLPDLREAARVAPQNSVIRLALGNLELQLGDTDAALAHMEAAYSGGIRSRELTGCLARLYLRKGASILQVGDETAGQSYIERATTLAPELKPWVARCKNAFLAMKAYRFAGAGNLAAAVPLWKRLESPERHLPVLHNLALAYERLQDPQKAAYYWQRWMRGSFSEGTRSKDQTLALEASRRLAKCLLESDRAREAALAFRSILEQLPEDADAHENLAGISMQEEDWDEALRHLQFLQQTRTESSTRWTQIGLARLMKDDVKGATEAWNRALELEPGNEAAQELLLDALEEWLAAMSPRQYALEGLRLIQDLVQRLPKHFGPHVVMARYFYTLNDRRRAKTSIERALQVDPQNPLAWLAALDLLLDLGTRAEIDEFGTQLFRQCGGDPRLHERAGIIYLQQGREKKASRHFQAAVESSNESMIPLNIGQAYIQAGDPGEAERYARLALQRDSKRGHCHVLLAMALMMNGKDGPASKHLGIAGTIARETGDDALLGLLQDLTRMKSFARMLFSDM